MDVPTFLEAREQAIVGIDKPASVGRLIIIIDFSKLLLSMDTRYLLFDCSASFVELRIYTCSSWCDEDNNTCIIITTGLIGNSNTTRRKLDDDLLYYDTSFGHAKKYSLMELKVSPSNLRFDYDIIGYSKMHFVDNLDMAVIIFTMNKDGNNLYADNNNNFSSAMFEVSNTMIAVIMASFTLFKVESARVERKLYDQK